MAIANCKRSSDTFWLFDSHRRESRGYPTPSKGSSILMKISNLLHFIKQIKIIFTLNEMKHEVFTISKINVSIIILI